MESSWSLQIDLRTNAHQDIEAALQHVGMFAGLWREPLQIWAHQGVPE